jgi:hypothetical protein
VLGAAVLALLALPRGGRRTALAFGVPCLVLWLPWLAHSARLTGNPVYPFLPAVFPTPDWSPALGEQFARWQRGIGMGRGALDYALLPVRVLTSGGPDYAHFGGRLGLHWLALAPLAAWLGRREPLVRIALAACALYFAAWALGSQQLRFLIPLLPPLAMACAFAVDAALDRLGAERRVAARACAAALAAAIAAFAVHAHYAAAGSALRALRSDAAARRAAAEEPVFRWANQALPADARVLLLDTNQRFFLERDALADSFFEASQLADWLAGADDADAAAARLRERGVTHVLWDRRRDWGIRWPSGLRALLADGERAPRRWRSADGRVEVFELASTR